MEDNSLIQQNGVGQVVKQVSAVSNNKENDETSLKAQYSIPGILHFIQHEWARFELERSQWEVDRAELQVSFLLYWYSLGFPFNIHYKYLFQYTRLQFFFVCFIIYF